MFYILHVQNKTINTPSCHTLPLLFNHLTCQNQYRLSHNQMTFSIKPLLHANIVNLEVFICALFCLRITGIDSTNNQKRFGFLATSYFFHVHIFMVQKHQKVVVTLFHFKILLFLNSCN